MRSQRRSSFLRVCQNQSVVSFDKRRSTETLGHSLLVKWPDARKGPREGSLWNTEELVGLVAVSRNLIRDESV